MDLTEILFQLLDKECRALKAGKKYLSAREARDAAGQALQETMGPEQRRLFHRHMERASYVDSLELQQFFSRCTLLVTSQENEPEKQKFFYSASPNSAQVLLSTILASA